jgi:hypothetical protein
MDMRARAFASALGRLPKHNVEGDEISSSFPDNPTSSYEIGQPRVSRTMKSYVPKSIAQYEIRGVAKMKAIALSQTNRV